jgi:hypothetical protein
MHGCIAWPEPSYVGMAKGADEFGKGSCAKEFIAKNNIRIIWQIIPRICSIALVRIIFNNTKG